MSNPAYQKYLTTDIWKAIRAQRLCLDNGECVLCGEEAKHVHHRRYPKKLGTETIKDLVSLCSSCHGKHHGKEDQPEQSRAARIVDQLERNGYEVGTPMENVLVRCGSPEEIYTELQLSSALLQVTINDIVHVEVSHAIASAKALLANHIESHHSEEETCTEDS